MASRLGAYLCLGAVWHIAALGEDSEEVALLQRSVSVLRAKPIQWSQGKAAQRAPGGCRSAAAIVAAMRQGGSSYAAQLRGCLEVGSCTASSSKADQDAAAAAGAVDAVVAAMQRFPDDKPIQLSCAMAVSGLILFNRENGLRAGQLGGLNTTLAFYRSHMDDPVVTSLGGAIGAYFDFVNENRAIARELGGIQLFIQNIRNNFHGRYSNWAYEPVKQSLFALSSGTWKNQDVAYNESFIPLSVQLMMEHGDETKIAEETLQAVKALVRYSDDFRREYSDTGIFEALVRVLNENPRDRGAISLACEGAMHLVGPTVMADMNGVLRGIPFDANIQARATRAGMVEALVATAMSGEERQHFEHGAFNFDVDAAYPADANCFSALHTMAYNNPANRAAMLQEGLPESAAKKLQAGALELSAKAAACTLLAQLGQPNSACLNLQQQVAA